jgi:uncharacterized damage-inducible protein DinB
MGSVSNQPLPIAKEKFMTTAVLPPQYPAGEFQRKSEYSVAECRANAARLRDVPQQLRQVVAGLTQRQLKTKYKNWTIRQIVNHLADSHMNAWLRFKFALTEEVPTIKPYNETLWSEVVDAKEGPIEPALQILDGVHARLAFLAENLSPAELQREFHHPQMGRNVALAELLAMYGWHSDHHIGQIKWLRGQPGF